MQTSASKPRRTWVWFFSILGIIALIAILLPFIVVPIVHNLQRLTPETLRLARQRWERNGPKNYQLDYRTKGSANGSYAVGVRGGRVVSATRDGQPLAPRLYRYQSMDGLFDDLERFLQLAADQSPRGIVLARFDPADGHLLRYIYSNPATAQKVEVSVELRPVEP